MAYGLDEGWVQSPPDVAGRGYDEWAAMTGVPATHALVGGASWGTDSSGFQPDTGLQRVVLGDGAPVGPARSSWDNWRDIFNFSGSPAPYVLLALVAAILLLHVRLTAAGGLRVGK